LAFSSVFTATPTIQAPGWALPFASESSNEQAGESGWSPRPDAVQRFTLQSRADEPGEPALRGKPASILLVEDSRADAELVREALEEHGVEGELIVLTNGENAIEFIRSLDAQRVECPNLVILDLNLPKTTGREVLKWVRQSVSCGQSPVVILSSSDAAEDRAETIGLGASRYIRKPSRLQEFMSLGAIFKTMLGGAPD
jgi:two-component system, chemotaxis family, response regulator Rcp1